MDHAKRHQAITYALAAVIEDTLREDFGIRGETIAAYRQRQDPHDPAVFGRLDSCGALFFSWSKAER